MSDETRTGGAITRATARTLLIEARRTRERAHAPYSGFRVGAALLDSEGRTHHGANVENASYGLSICAEVASVTAAITAGAGSFMAIAIAGPDERKPCLPCGRCRQILWEFSPDMLVVTDDPSGPRLIPLRSLLPDAFGRATLESVEATDG